MDEKIESPEHIKNTPKTKIIKEQLDQKSEKKV